MAHTDIDVVTHLFLALYPAAALFGVEISARLARSKQWVKYTIQGMVCIAFAIAYVTLIDAIGISLMLMVLAPALFIQARKAKGKA